MKNSQKISNVSSIRFKVDPETIEALNFVVDCYNGDTEEWDRKRQAHGRPPGGASAVIRLLIRREEARLRAKIATDSSSEPVQT